PAAKRGSAIKASAIFIASQFARMKCPLLWPDQFRPAAGNDAARHLQQGGFHEGRAVRGLEGVHESMERLFKSVLPVSQKASACIRPHPAERRPPAFHPSAP